MVESYIIIKLVQRYCVSQNHSSAEHSQSALQDYMFGTTNIGLWLETSS